MDREGQNLRVLVEDLLDPVAVMGVDVDVEDPGEPPLQDRDGEGVVVENAEARSLGR